MFSLYASEISTIVKNIEEGCNSVALLFDTDKIQCMNKIMEVESLRESLLSILNNHHENQYTHHDYNSRYQFILDVIDYASTMTVFYKLDILNNR